MKNKKIIICISLFVAVILLALSVFLIGGSIKRNSVLDHINGETYSGSSENDMHHYNIRITFTDDEHCDIYFEEYIDGVCYTDTPLVTDIPYKITGNMFNAALEWDSHAKDNAPNCPGKFNVRYKSSGEIYFYNSDYYGTFLDLEKGADNFRDVDGHDSYNDSHINECYICGCPAIGKYGSYHYCYDCMELVKKYSD